MRWLLKFLRLKKSEIVEAEVEEVRKNRVLNTDIADTFIAEDAVMLGYLKVGGRVVVSGKFSGNLNESKNGAALLVDEGAAVRGNIDVSTSHILGEVEGALTSAMIYVQSTGKLSGSIKYDRLKSEGGIANARLIKEDNLIALKVDEEVKKYLV